jgi:predicted nucleotidyltransferase
VRPKHKVVRVPEFRYVRYDERRWQLLRELRARALDIMRKLASCGYSPIVHGSVARGDVDEGSDVDVVIPYTEPPSLVELCLERYGTRVVNKVLVKATPKSALRVVYELAPDGRVSVSLPLERLSPQELEFYRFGGELALEELEKDIRVPGVTKSLVLIVPVTDGHMEAPVRGYEHYVAKVLGISLSTVLERVKLLTRRDEIGRTGLFLKVVLDLSEPVEEALKRLKSCQRD